jgi:wobble nucleotide-excising tRNase
MFKRKDVADAAKDFAAHVSVVDDVAHLQSMQKEMSNAIAKLNDRITNIEAEIRVLKAEVKLDAVREASQMVSAVQGAFHEKLTELTVRISHAERDRTHLMALPKSGGRGEASELPPG